MPAEMRLQWIGAGQRAQAVPAGLHLRQRLGDDRATGALELIDRRAILVAGPERAERHIMAVRDEPTKEVKRARPNPGRRVRSNEQDLQ